ncbi:MAG: hypothetical protein HRU41_04500 [Saprospiraceae bacterium]|nr:hypothetical protein [Saprospiraceae bacterium]
MEKPKITEITSSAVFQSWYWLKVEMVEKCKQLGLPYAGGKFELRDRIIYALENDGALMPVVEKSKPTSKFNWAKANLSLDTEITDNVKFGPNFRRFMSAQIGPHFSCHSDFMDWVKEHPGKTLRDAVIKWEELERRKEDPSFQREIAEHNMLAQYVRDFMADNPESRFQDALRCWKAKKQLPAKGGFVKYNQKDLVFIQ